MREWEWLGHIPAFKTYMKAGKVRVRYLTHDQAKALMDRLPAHQREVVLFALSTGLRQGNILKLTWGQVDMARRIATVDHGDTKNGEALGVPLNEIAMGVLERQRGKHRTQVFTLSGPTAPFGEHADVACGIAGLRDREFPLARSAAHLGELAPAE